MSENDRSYHDKVKNKGLESDRVAREVLLRRQQLSRNLYAQRDWIPGDTGKKKFPGRGCHGRKDFKAGAHVTGSGKGQGAAVSEF